MQAISSRAWLWRSPGISIVWLAAVGAVLLLCTLPAGASETNEPRSESPPPENLELRVPDGFEIERVAAPPVVKYPMMGSIDERGRIFVAESGGVNQTAPELLKSRPHKILLLEDKDGDGRYEKSTVFADNLAEPNGALWHEGALYVCSAPYLWRFEDTDGDGRADKRQRILGKFNFYGMSDALHGPVLGPDGRLYFCGGQHGWTLAQYTADQGRDEPDPATEAEQPEGEGIAGKWASSAPGLFACWPDGSGAEAVASGGICNPVKAAFTPEGEALGTVAVYDMFDGRHDAVLHWIEGGVFNLRPINHNEVPRTGRVLTPVSRRGHVAPAGIIRYQGTQFGTDYTGSLFLCEFNTHKVYRLALDRRGATFASRDEVFLETDDSNRHFTDLIEDADGSLLVVDTGGWFLRGCPTSQIARPEILGGIYRIRRKGAQAASDPCGTTIAWDTLPAAELTALLGDQRPAVQQRAIAALGRRGLAAVSALRAVLTNDSPVVRRNAVWALCRISGDESCAAVREALSDTDRSVRMAAMHVAGLHRDREAAKPLIASLADEHPAERRQAATALGRIGERSASEPLLVALAASDEPFMDHAIIYALARINDADRLKLALAAPSSKVQRGALLALDQAAADKVPRADVQTMLRSTNPALQTAALNVAVRHRWTSEAAAVLLDWLTGPQLDAARRGTLSDVLRSVRDDGAIDALLARALVERRASSESRLLVLDAMSGRGSKTPPAIWQEPLARSLGFEDEQVVLKAIEVATRFGAKNFSDALAGVARDESRASHVRISAAAQLALTADVVDDALFDVLVAHCSAEEQPVERLTAARALGGAKLSDSQRQRLVDVVAGAGPLELPALVGAFEATSDGAVGMQFLKALERSQGVESLPPARVEKLFSTYPQNVRTASAKLLKRLGLDPAEQAQRLSALEKALAGGDVKRGSEVFFGKQASCSACHQVGRRGFAIGPNLTQIGAIRTPRDLLEAVVFPSSSFARGFEPVAVATDEGKIYSGTISRDAADAVYLRLSDRTEMRIGRDEIESLVPSKVSIMPQGLDKTLTVEQMQDLIAFLASLR